jgi:pyridinium-3,5-bisthiocarboxylic acid mononucleotide nickel chelatase
MRDSILYIEATSGASGDMLLGALLDVGVPPEALSDAWTSLNIDNYTVEIFETTKSGMQALQCRVKTEEARGPKTWKQYRALIEKSNLPDEIKQQTCQLVERLFEIEASIHRTSLQKLHLHEMGGTDLLLDVVGVLTGFAYLQPAAVHCSPVNVGRGFLTFSHGTYPVPAPATTKLLEGIPIFQNQTEGELTTPTGALLIRHLATSFGDMPSMILKKTGVGAGEKEIPDHPNVLRIFLGSRTSSDDEIFLIETNIDDSSPQVLGYFMEKALEMGALDVFFTPIYMKKNRPAVRLSLLTPGNLMESILDLLFTETSAIGLRYWKVDRKKLARRWSKVRIGKQFVRIKESYLDGTLYNYQPEYEDCKKAAGVLKRPIKEVMAQAIHQYLSRK